MSWDSYIDTLIVQTKDASGATHCERACIIALDGGALWTGNNKLKLTTSEAANIAKAFKTKNFSAIMASGVSVEGITFQFLREEDEKTLYVRKAGHGSVTMKASKKAIVCGKCPEGGLQGYLNKGVGVVVDYLESMNM